MRYNILYMITNENSKIFQKNRSHFLYIIVTATEHNQKKKAHVNV